MLLLLLVALAASLPIRLAHRTIETGVKLRRSTETIERGIFVVQFTTAIDAPLLLHLTAVLGYTPNEYVPSNALIIFINDTDIGEAFNEAFTGRIKHLERLTPADRRANLVLALDAMQAHPVSPLMRAEPGPSVASTAERVRMRVRSFYGALNNSTGYEERYERRFRDSLYGVSSATPLVGEGARTVTLDDLEPTEAEAASDAILSTLDDVYWIDLLAPYEINNAWSIPTAHRASDAEKPTAPPVAQVGAWAPVLGLRGANQTIGLSDTGIANMCFFCDGLAARAWPQVNGIASVPADTRHPKVRAYSSGSGGDFGDAGSTSGHGTHVAGTLAGRAQVGSISAPYNGGAPDARIAFVDLLRGSTNRNYLAVPDLTKMFQWMYNAGARVSSASWGSNNGGRYTTDDRVVDSISWRLRELLIVYAAGNAGSDASISTPAMNKNGLTVGATMNGYNAFALVLDAPLPYADYSPRWLADFSSRGAASLPFAKPDVVAPGGYYIWSASNRGPTSCANDETSTAGYAGTSMATPLVAATAALIYEAFQTYPTMLSAHGGGALPVYASLVRAVLAAGARPLDGIYPHTPYASATARRNAEGFGRIALDRALGPSVSLAVMSNEKEAHGLLASGNSVRGCVAIDGLAANATLAGYELVIQLAYADYPSSVVAQPTLVNNLDLRVTPIGTSTVAAVNYGAPNGSETRTTLERVIISPARAVDVQVYAQTIGFGGPQTFSLIAVLRPITPTNATITRSLTVTPLGITGVCAACLDGVVRPAGDCQQCGNGRVEGNEQCEGTTCCAACRFTTSSCTVAADECVVTGQCAAGECNVNQAQGYRVSGDTCTPTSSPSACTRRTGTWMAAVRAGTNSSERICCQEWAKFAYDKTPADPLFHKLATHYIAARLNLGLSGVAVNVSVISAVGQAKALLNSSCTGFVESQRATARELVGALASLNERACAAAAPSYSCSVSTDFCHGSTYSDTASACQCPDTRVGPQCEALRCSGHGVSVHDHADDSDRCVCLPGWEGAACDDCAEPDIPNTRFICLGATGSAKAAGSPNYILRAVASASVQGRLNGTFYTALARKLGRTIANKTADALPGTGSLDCWCQTADAEHDSAAGYVEAARDILAQQLQWYAGVESDLVGSTIVHASAARLHISLVAILLWLY